MRNSTGSILAAAIVVASSNLLMASAEARPAMALAIRAGTPGAGLDYDINLFSRVNARVGYSGMSISPSFEITDDKDDPQSNSVDYDIKLKMSQAFGLIDLYVFNGGFRISLGGVGSKTTIDTVGKPTNGSYDLGNGSYPAGSITSVNGKIKIGDGISPYVGIGWGNPLNLTRHWTFMFDLGAIHAGAPEVSLTATCSATTSTAQCNAIQRDAQVEIRDLKDDLDNEWYPVISFGVAYRF
jgi:hypothetical protein